MILHVSVPCSNCSGVVSEISVLSRVSPTSVCTPSNTPTPCGSTIPSCCTPVSNDPVINTWCVKILQKAFQEKCFYIIILHGSMQISMHLKLILFKSGDCIYAHMTTSHLNCY